MRSIIEIIVGSTDIDWMNHVNNKKYIEYLERGRTDFYSKTGFSRDKFLEKGLGRTIVSLKVQYNMEVSLGEKLYIHTFPMGYGRSSIKFKQEIYNCDNKKVSEAEVVSVVVDVNKRKSTNIPKEMLACLTYSSLEKDGLSDFLG
jgi:thioesterase III